MTKPPAKKPKIPDNADDKEQSERFLETAREHEADADAKKPQSKQ
jgi:hypothetical protein